MYNKTRFATIDTFDTDGAIFATLEKEEYLRVVLKADEKKMAEEIRIMKQFPILNMLTRISLHKLYLQMKIVKLKRGMFVFKEEDAWQHFYLIKSGQFE